MRPASLLILTLIASVAVFAVIQDRITAAGARRYVALQRQAVASGGPLHTIDDVMQPAIRRSVRLGAAGGGAVLVAGGAIAFAVSRRRR